MDGLSNPISELSPCGEYLKGNRSLYRTLRNSFNQAQSSYRQLMESPDAMVDEALIGQNIENWSDLADKCRINLQEVSKDTEIFCWLSTAQLFTPKPLENLDTILGCFVEVLRNFWDDLNPKPPVEKLKSSDPADQAKEWVEIRIQPLLQLVGETETSGQLFMPLQSMGLVGNISFSQYLSAEKSGKKDALKADVEKILAASREDIVNNILLLGRIADHFKNIEEIVNEKCRESGAEKISFKYINQLVRRLIDALHYMVADYIKPWPLNKAEDKCHAHNDAHNPVSEINHEDKVVPVRMDNQLYPDSGLIYTRTQAFHELRRISDYFNRTEPHSPVYMLLERAIRWGQLSLPELIAEMVGDNAQVMQRIHHLAGLESIEKTVIPDATITAQDMVFRQPASSDYQVGGEHPVPSSLPDASAENTLSEKEGAAGNKSAGIANFDW